MGLVYNAFLPGVSDSDVVSRKVKLVVDGSVAILTVSPDTKVLELPPIKDNSSVEISLSDVDDAGNESGYNTPLKFTAVDTIVPAVPGIVNVKLVREVDDVAPEADTKVEPAPKVIESSAVVAPLVVNNEEDEEETDNTHADLDD